MDLRFGSAQGFWEHCAELEPFLGRVSELLDEVPCPFLGRVQKLGVQNLRKLVVSCPC